MDVFCSVHVAESLQAHFKNFISLFWMWSHQLLDRSNLTTRCQNVSGDSFIKRDWNVVKCILRVVTASTCRVKWHFSEPHLELLLIKGMALSPPQVYEGMNQPAQWKNPRAINSTQFTFRLGFIWPLYKFSGSRQEQMKESLLGDHYSANCFRNVPCT